MPMEFPLTDRPEVRIVPRLIEGEEHTDVLFVWQGQYYSSRYNYVLANNTVNNQLEAEKFMARRRHEVGVG